MDIQQNDRLKFDVPTVLFGASPIGSSVLKVTQKFKSWPVLAADGGLNAAINAGLMPQMVIGDMDSVTDLDQLPVSVRQIRLSATLCIGTLAPQPPQEVPDKLTTARPSLADKTFSYIDNMLGSISTNCFDL